jgi:hypothetical protein
MATQIENEEQVIDSDEEWLASLSPEDRAQVEYERAEQIKQFLAEQEDVPPNAFTAMLVPPVSHSFTRFRLYREDELDRFPDVEWFPGLEGIVPKRELLGLWGEGDSYKSFVAIDWACWLASIGLDVLYIAAEGGSGIRQRILAWKQHYNVEELPHLHVMPEPVKMHEPADVALFVAAVETQLAGVRPILVVVDTLARNFVGGNENSAQDLGLFVEGAEQIRRRFGCTVVVVHHSTKDGTSERGGESLRNASFAMYRFERKSAGSVEVACERMKDAEPPKPVLVRPVLVDLGEGKSSLVAGWPYGADLTAPLNVLAIENEHTRKMEMDQAITAYLAHERELGRPNCSARQVAKNVDGRDSTVIERLKALSLEDFSPVQVEKDVLADGSPGKGLRYFYELRTPPDPD